jgi:hypothetical protein
MPQKLLFSTSIARQSQQYLFKHSISMIGWEAHAGHLDVPMHATILSAVTKSFRRCCRRLQNKKSRKFDK